MKIKSKHYIYLYLTNLYCAQRHTCKRILKTQFVSISELFGSGSVDHMKTHEKYLKEPRRLLKSNLKK